MSLNLCVKIIKKYVFYKKKWIERSQIRCMKFSKRPSGTIYTPTKGSIMEMRIWIVFLPIGPYQPSSHIKRSDGHLIRISDQDKSHKKVQNQWKSVNSTLPQSKTSTCILTNDNTNRKPNPYQSPNRHILNHQKEIYMWGRTSTLLMEGESSEAITKTCLWNFHTKGKKRAIKRRSRKICTPNIKPRPRLSPVERL